MATSVFKGRVGTGRVTAVFHSDFSNVSSDLLTESYADVTGGNAQVAHDAIAPGGSGRCDVNAVSKGLLEVMVIAANDQESGRLRTEQDGNLVHDEPVTGSVRWVYAVTP